VRLHTREDEFSFVLEGRWGFQLGSDVVYAEPGDLVYKPRDVWHTFWTATDRPARLLEIISPAGFEQLLVELNDLLKTDPDNLEAAAALGAKYGIESDSEATAQVAAGSPRRPPLTPSPWPRQPAARVVARPAFTVFLLHRLVTIASEERLLDVTIVRPMRERHDHGPMHYGGRPTPAAGHIGPVRRSCRARCSRGERRASR
jgi:hypothetical protein